MAKKHVIQRGGGDLAQQIKRLKGEIGPKGVKAANEIVEGYEPDVIKLAFKMVPKGLTANSGLGKRIEAMLANMPAKQATETRKRLIVARG